MERNECKLKGCAPIGQEDSDTCLGASGVSQGGGSDVTEGASGGGGSVKRWCRDAATLWPSGKVPAMRDNVTIAAGVVVELDCDTAILNRLDIFGTLRFLDTADRTLEAHFVHVAAETGALYVGTEAAPFQHTAKLRIHGARSSPVYPNSGLGSKFIAIFGMAEFIGRSRPSRVFTALLRDAKAGDTFIYFNSSDTVGWADGDEIVLTSSGLTSSEAELRTLLSIKSNATHATARLSEPLAFPHYGANTASYSSSTTVNIPGEVAHVGSSGGTSLNIIVEGVEGAAAAYTGTDGLS